MEIFETLLIFVALVIVSSFVHTFIPKVPLAFIQIFLGMIFIPHSHSVEFNFDSELFMVTLIAHYYSLRVLMFQEYIWEVYQTCYDDGSRSCHNYRYRRRIVYSLDLA